MEFPRRNISDSNIFLESAQNAESYVHSFLKQSDDGIYSDEVSGAGRHNLYVGTAGILHMYIEFDLITNESRYKHIISEMVRFLSIHALDGVEIAKKEGEFVPGMAEAFYSGIGGIGLVLNEAFRTCKDENARTNARTGSEKILDYYRKHITETKQGVYWSENSPIFFDGGIILYLIDCLNTYADLEDTLKNLIEKATDYILEHGIYHENGGLEIDYHHVDFKHKEPNFEFGTAGVGYLFAKVYEITKNEKYLEAAIAATVYLKDISVSQKKGYLIPYKLGKYDDLFYLGNCHGPVGTAKLFYELYLISNQKKYFEEVVQLVEGAESLGAPFGMSAGFWNTTCVCCGPAGYMPLFIGLYRATGDMQWKTLSHKVGEVLVGTQKRNHWEIAFDRTEPDIITSPAGYFTGAAGIAVSLLQIYSLETNVGKIVSFIDDPYRK